MLFYKYCPYQSAKLYVCECKWACLHDHLSVYFANSCNGFILLGKSGVIIFNMAVISLTLFHFVGKWTHSQFFSHFGNGSR